MAGTLNLVSLELPPTFPPEALPEVVASFVRTCPMGSTQRALISDARRRGWDPSWEPLKELDQVNVKAFGFALVVTGLVIPLIARMTRTATKETPNMRERDPRQLELF